MKLSYRTVSENAWVFPGDRVSVPTEKTAVHTARGGSVLFQVVTGFTLEKETSVRLHIEGANGVTVQLNRLESVCVDQNSAPRGLPRVTDDYEAVRDFVTRRAPFDVFDVLAPVCGTLAAGELALAFRLKTSGDAPVGQQDILLKLESSEFSLEIPVELTVHKAAIPPLAESRFTVCNWIYPNYLAADHGLTAYSEEYYAMLETYMDHLQQVRSNVFAFIDGKRSTCARPIRDETGKVVDFDLTDVERHLQLAKKKGFTILEGPFVACWMKWKDTNLKLIWDLELDVTTQEAYRQLAIYFTRTREMIERNGWQDCYWQTLADEPQTHSEPAYHQLAGIFRRFVPGILVSDPIESTGVAGAVDIWCIKQATYEKYLDTYRDYQAMGERMSIYSCGFPAGDTMNRVLDLPLSAGRLMFWMCHRYGLEGFLHWGYHVHAAPEERRHMVNGQMPAGNQNIVYPEGDTVYESVRSFNQLAGAEDWELLNIVKQADPACADALIASVARTFDDYERDPEAVTAARIRLLEAADRCC